MQLWKDSKNLQLTGRWLHPEKPLLMDVWTCNNPIVKTVFDASASSRVIYVMYLSSSINISKKD